MLNQLKNKWISLVVAILVGFPYGIPTPLAFAENETIPPEVSPTGAAIPVVPVAEATSRAVGRGAQGTRIARPDGQEYTEPGVWSVPCPPGTPPTIACAVAAAEVSREPSVPTESDSPLSRVELPVEEPKMQRLSESALPQGEALVGRSNTGAWAYEEVGDNPPFRGAKIIGCDGSKGTCSAVSAAGVEETPPTPPTPAATLSAQVVQTPSQPEADATLEVSPVPTDEVPSTEPTAPQLEVIPVPNVRRQDLLPPKVDRETPVEPEASGATVSVTAEKISPETEPTVPQSEPSESEKIEQVPGQVVEPAEQQIPLVTFPIEPEKDREEPEAPQPRASIAATVSHSETTVGAVPIAEGGAEPVSEQVAQGTPRATARAATMSMTQTTSAADTVIEEKKDDSPPPIPSSLAKTFPSGAVPYLQASSPISSKTRGSRYLLERGRKKPRRR